MVNRHATLEDNGDTLLIGFVVEQAALHGLLRKVRDLGVQLISLNRVESSLEDMSDGDNKWVKRAVNFPLWLVIKNVNVEQWEKRAFESA